MRAADDRDRRPGTGEQQSAIFQATCSPIRNPLSRFLRYGNTFASFGIAGVAGRLLARSAGLREQALRWKLEHGPKFDNALATLDLDGRTARRCAGRPASSTRARSSPTSSRSRRSSWSESTAVPSRSGCGTLEPRGTIAPCRQVGHDRVRRAGPAGRRARAALAIAALVIPRLIDPTRSRRPTLRRRRPSRPASRRSRSCRSCARRPGTPIAERAGGRSARSSWSRPAGSRCSTGRSTATTAITSITGDPPYATDEVTLQPYGDGVVIGPAPGASTPGPGAGVRDADAVPPRAGGRASCRRSTAAATGSWTPSGPPPGRCRDAPRHARRSGVGHRPVEHPCEFVPERETVGRLRRAGRLAGRPRPAGASSTRRPARSRRSAARSSASADRLRRRVDPELATRSSSRTWSPASTSRSTLPPGGRPGRSALSADGRYLAVVLVEHADHRPLVRGVGARPRRRRRRGWRRSPRSAAGPLDLAWQGDVLVVRRQRRRRLRRGDRRALPLGRSSSMPSRLDVVARRRDRGGRPAHMIVAGMP